MSGNRKPGARQWRTQYGVRWATGSVFAFPSREAAEGALNETGRSGGVLVVHEYEPDTPNCTEWREVEG
jgi:hypothetical protein